jgi:hypothetical protein
LVESINKKRLSLDFTPDVKSDGMEEQLQDSSQASQASTKSSVSNSAHATSMAAGMSAEELAEWAAIALEGEDLQKSVAEEDKDKMEDEDAACVQLIMKIGWQRDRLKLHHTRIF